MKTGDRVQLFNRITGKPLLGYDQKPSFGTVGRCDEKAIGVRHEGGAVTMVQQPRDPMIELRKVETAR
jgi:hypothetical protein